MTPRELTTTPERPPTHPYPVHRGVLRSTLRVLPRKMRTCACSSIIAASSIASNRTTINFPRIVHAINVASASIVLVTGSVQESSSVHGVFFGHNARASDKVVQLRRNLFIVTAHLYAPLAVCFLEASFRSGAVVGHCVQRGLARLRVVWSASSVDVSAWPSVRNDRVSEQDEGYFVKGVRFDFRRWWATASSAPPGSSLPALRTSFPAFVPSS